jgi:hypothetical protein
MAHVSAVCNGHLFSQHDWAADNQAQFSFSSRVLPCSIIPFIDGTLQRKAFLPATSADRVAGIGKPTSRAKGLESVRIENDLAAIRFGDGTYRFQAVR